MRTIDVTMSPRDGYLEITVSGKFTADALEALANRLEAILDERAPLRMLLIMSDFHGWTLRALWKEARFDLRHRREIGRVALVGDRPWQHGLALLSRPFSAAQLRYFDVDRLDEARAWLSEPAAEGDDAGVGGEITGPLRELGSDDRTRRERARRELTMIGEPAVPALARATRSGPWQIRWEATKALAAIDGASTIEPLVAALHEGDDIRWIAAERLKHQGRPAVEALLRALVASADSVGLCHGAHHVLDQIDDAELRELVDPVVVALADSDPVVVALADSDPAAAVPPAADAALQQLHGAGSLGGS